MELRKNGDISNTKGKPELKLSLSPKEETWRKFTPLLSSEGFCVNCFVYSKAALFMLVVRQIKDSFTPGQRCPENVEIGAVTAVGFKLIASIVSTQFVFEVSTKFENCST